jgi:hypothetical protein
LGRIPLSQGWMKRVDSQNFEGDQHFAIQTSSKYPDFESVDLSCSRKQKGLVVENSEDFKNHQNCFHTFEVEAFDYLVERSKGAAAAITAEMDQINSDKKDSLVRSLNSHQ